MDTRLRRLLVNMTAGFVAISINVISYPAHAQQHVHIPANVAINCVHIVIKDDRRYFQNDCPWGVSISWPGGLWDVSRGGHWPTNEKGDFEWFACKHDRKSGAGVWQSSEMAANHEYICEEPVDDSNPLVKLSNAYDKAKSAYEKAKAIYNGRIPGSTSGAYAKRNDAHSDELESAMNNARRYILDLVPKSQVVGAIQNASFSQLKSQIQQLNGDMAALESAIQSIGTDKAEQEQEKAKAEQETRERRARLAGAIRAQQDLSPQVQARAQQSPPPDISHICSAEIASVRSALWCTRLPERCNLGVDARIEGARRSPCTSLNDVAWTRARIAEWEGRNGEEAKMVVCLLRARLAHCASAE